jgi:DNA helicase-2/ATP-dependent DNA helicase PcrA
MYVGLTRAKEEIYLLFTRQRTLFGSTQMNAPSRFLEDIPEKFMKHDSYYETQQKEFEKLLKNKKKRVFCSRSRNSRFKGGEKVKHEELGEGVVVSAAGDIIVVAFKKAGIKRLSLEFAKLKKV